MPLKFPRPSEGVNFSQVSQGDHSPKRTGLQDFKFIHFQQQFNSIAWCRLGNKTACDLPMASPRNGMTGPLVMSRDR